MAGYDGVEISAIKGMCEHLNLDRWREQAAELKQIVADNGLEFLSMEEAALDEERLLQAFEAGAEIGIPIINVGPGGKSGVDEDCNAPRISCSRWRRRPKALASRCAARHMWAARSITRRPPCRRWQR